MCGITGILDRSGVSRNDAILSMTELLVHRGPDGRHSYSHDKVNFGHTRLAIIDLSHRADCPFTIDDQYTITYNGECYNYIELRSELKRLGHSFSTSSDTEVVLRAYMEWGESFTSKLNGIFSMAIYDLKNQVVILCRDRLGVKPLYYKTCDGQFLFASEIKPILRVTGEKSINWNKVGEYFRFRYVPGNQTLFDGVVSLSPGSVIRFDLRRFIFEEKSYWDPTKITYDLERSYEESSHRFVSLLEDSCRIQLRSDVPVGVFLSGGVDSSSIAALAAQHAPGLQSFTMDMNCDLNENPAAKRTAKYLGLKHSSLKLGETDFDHYRKAIYHLEEPLGDSIIAPSLLLSEFAAKDCKVVLCGEGADELLNGYVHHYALFHQNRLFSKLPSIAPSLVAELIRLLPIGAIEKFFPYPAMLGSSGVNKLIAQLECYNQSPYLSLTTLFNSESDLISSELFEQKGDLDHFMDSRSSDLMSDVTFADLMYWTPNYTLTRLDKLTMANSLEARVPFFDHRLVEHALSIPAVQKTNLFRQKCPLRDGMIEKGLLPRSVVEQKKTPFFLPVEKSFSGEKLSEWVGDLLSPTRLKARGIYNVDQVTSLINQRDKGIIEHKRMMSLALFELWHTIFFE